MTELSKQLPDTPRWIYARSLVISGRGKVYIDKDKDRDSFVVANPATGIVCIVGKPAAELVYDAIHETGEGSAVLAAINDSVHIGQILSDWERSHALLHTLQDTSRYKNIDDDAIRFVTIDELSGYSNIPPELFNELEIGSKHSSIAALFENDLPVSFCYAVAETETLWDISIDTLDEFRTRGYAERCVSVMIHHMLLKGKMPVWGSEISNVASLRLADKLGFIPVDKLVLFRMITQAAENYLGHLYA